MNNLNRFCIVFDWETDGLPSNPKAENIKKLIEGLGGDKDKTWKTKLRKRLMLPNPKFAHVNPTQLGATVINLANCQIEKDSEFNIIICPDELKKLGDKVYYENHKSTIDWHAREVMKCEPSDVIKLWKTGVSEKEAWNDFLVYCKEYTVSEKFSEMPIAGGQNIIGFDIPIAENQAFNHGTKYPFAKRETFDLLNFSIPWFFYSSNPPVNYKLETLRKIKGLGLTQDEAQDQAHNAIVDVRHTAIFLCKFLSLHKELVQKIKVLNNLEMRQ